MTGEIKPLQEPHPALAMVHRHFLYEGAIDPEGKRNDLVVHERPIESVQRRLKELGITQARMAQALQVSPKHVNQVLREKSRPSEQFLHEMLDYVGLEMVAIPDLLFWKSRDGHWFHGERCQYCGVNVYDTTEPCAVSRNKGARK